MKEGFDLLGVLFKYHLGSFLVLLFKLRKRVELCSHFKLFGLDTIEIEEYLVLLQGCEFCIPKT